MALSVKVEEEVTLSTPSQTTIESGEYTVSATDVFYETRTLNIATGTPPGPDVPDVWEIPVENITICRIYCDHPILLEIGDLDPITVTRLFIIYGVMESLTITPTVTATTVKVIAGA